MPVIQELRLDFRMRQIVNRGRIIGAVLVPTPDLVWNSGGVFQFYTVQESGDLFAGRRMGQLLIRDRADDFVADGSVSERDICPEQRQEQNAAQRRKRNPTS